jgi:hypothetical protein
MRHLSFRLTARCLSATIIAATACSSSTAPIDDGLADFQTDSASYTLGMNSDGYTGTIGVTYTNKTTLTASFENCGGSTDYQLQKLTNGEWKSVWSPINLLCLSAPILVPPGQQHQTKIVIFGGFPGTNTGPTFSITDISGTYRAMWTEVTAVQNASSSGAPLPIEHRVSNEFTLVAPPRGAN